MGSSSLPELNEMQGYLDLIHNTGPKCFDQDSYLIGSLSFNEVLSLMQLASLGEAILKTAKSQTLEE